MSNPARIGLVRFRIDGVLHQVYQIPMAVEYHATSRIKLLGRMDVIEAPSPGRTHQDLDPDGQGGGATPVDLPTAFGENWSCAFSIPDVWSGISANSVFRKRTRARWNQMTRSPNGDHSGDRSDGLRQTTTLYTTLKQLATSEVNVCTIEDPIEKWSNRHSTRCRCSRRSTSVRRRRPFPDAPGSRHHHGRRNPRFETADVAIQAALTGHHLVLSTCTPTMLPRPSPVSARSRGAGLFINSTVLGIMAQRLVDPLSGVQSLSPFATNSGNCGILVVPWKANHPATIHQPTGCLECRMTGYLGRAGLRQSS